MEVKNEIKLSSPPTDWISSVKFVGNSQLLLASSWDCCIYLYHCSNDILLSRSNITDRPILDALPLNNSSVFAGDLDGTCFVYDFSNETTTLLGNDHEDAVKVVDFSDSHALVLTGSWDCHVKLWDIRTKQAVECLNQNGQVHSMNVRDDILVVATDDKKVNVWDLRNMGSILQRRSSLLKHQTRCIRISPNKKSFAISSIEGRIAVQYFNQDPEIQKEQFTFRAHRIKKNDNEPEFIYPVNAIAFHPTTAGTATTFASGGSDGLVMIWDAYIKRRLNQFHQFPAGISYLSFNNTGNSLAIACSYQYEEGMNPLPKPEDAIFIRTFT